MMPYSRKQCLQCSKTVHQRSWTKLCLCNDFFYGLFLSRIANHLPSSGSFLAEASRSATLAAKDTLLLDSDCWRLSKLRLFLSAFLFLFCISFSYTAHLFSCWLRRFWAARSLSRLGTLSSCCSSWINSRWLAMLPARMDSSSCDDWWGWWWWRGGVVGKGGDLARSAPSAVASSLYLHHPVTTSNWPEREDRAENFIEVIIKKSKKLRFRYCKSNHSMYLQKCMR